ncbi:MAG: hypothetical protein QM504_03365 [Pseudomonadota bacterium]
MKVLLLLFLSTFMSIGFAVDNSYQPPKTKSPQEIIDEVNNGIDSVECGINNIAQDAVNIVNTQIVNELNSIIQNVLSSYDLGCIEALLDSGFLGIFNIDFNLPSFCEVVSGAINRNKDSPLFKTNKGKEFKSFIENSVKEKKKVKERIMEY